MAVKISSFKASVKKFAKKVAKAYATKSEGRIRSGSEGTSTSKCGATCILVSEDGYKEPVCLDHPDKEMEMERLMKGEVEKVGVLGYKSEGGMGGGLRGGCFYESESESEDSEDEWNEKTLCEGYEGYANLSFDVESLEEELYMEEKERASALYLAFGNVDGEMEENFKEQNEKMRTRLVDRVEKWLSKVEALDVKLEEPAYPRDVASMFTVGTLVTKVIRVSEEKGEVEAGDRLEKNEVVEKKDDAGSVWDVTPEEELENYFRCKKGKEVKVKVCA